jgi:hypothetical protein
VYAEDIVFSALFMRMRAAHILALSLCPEEAACYLARIYNTLVIFDPPPLVRNYRGRVVIHSLGYPDHPETALLCEELMDDFGFDADTFPAYALQGLATVSEVYPYHEERFALERENHGYREGLGEVRQRIYEQTGQRKQMAWGVKLTDTYFLQEPLYDVLPPMDTATGDFWLPQHEGHVTSFDLVLARDILVIGS